MAIEPGTTFQQRVVNMGRQIIITRTLNSSLFSDDSYRRAFLRGLRRVILEGLRQVAPLCAAVPGLTVSAGKEAVCVTLRYSEASAIQFTDADVKQIIGCCESAIDRCLGINPAYDKGVE